MMFKFCYEMSLLVDKMLVGDSCFPYILDNAQLNKARVELGSTQLNVVC